MPAATLPPADAFVPSADLAGRASAAPPLVLGGGPAGLTAALAMAREGHAPVVLEAGERVGGLARTEVRNGYRFDLGGHRFFTKEAAIEAMWHEVLGDELLTRPRLSRIYWNQRFLDYPLRAGNVVRSLGPLELTRCMGSYVRASTGSRRRRCELSFEDWVSNRFGRRLFELFFRSYTEKIWGVPTSEIRAEWAAQRIQNLSFFSAARNALGLGENNVKSLIEEFLYPRFGPGQLWEAMADEVIGQGGTVRLRERVCGLELDGDRLARVRTIEDTLECSSAVSSLPLQSVVDLAMPAAPSHVREAAAGLRYRDFLTVALVLEGDAPFPDNWIYIHEPEVRVGRIQNYGAWSPWMVPDEGTACVGLEYFCFEGDDLWTSPDDALVELASNELDRLGLCEGRPLRAGHVVRVPRAYPIYDASYAARVGTIRQWLDRIENLQQVGRNGLHRYNNCDHSMLTALRAVENLLHGATHDVWTVNTESAYHEEQRPEEQPYRDAPPTPAMGRTLPERA